MDYFMLEEFAKHIHVDLNLSCANAIQGAERELCLIFDAVDTSGQPDKAFLGRGGTIKSKLVTNIPKTCGAAGQADWITLGLNLIEVRARELSILMGLVSRSQDPVRISAWSRRWTANSVVLRKPRGYISKVFLEMGGSWELHV